MRSKDINEIGAERENIFNDTVRADELSDSDLEKMTGGFFDDFFVHAASVFNKPVSGGSYLTDIAKALGAAEKA